MKILDTELEFDFNDANDMEKLENAVDETKKVLAKINTTGEKTSVVIKQSCQAIFQCFNSIWGEGTDIKIFGNKVNLMTCIKAFEDLAEERMKQEQQFENEIENINKKYGINRAMRRTKK